MFEQMLKILFALRAICVSSDVLAKLWNVWRVSKAAKCLKQVRRPEHAGFWAGARAAMLMKSFFHWTINPDYAPRSNENAFPEEISFQKSSKTTVPLRTFWFLFPKSAVCFSHKSPKDHRAATPLFFIKKCVRSKKLPKPPCRYVPVHCSPQKNMRSCKYHPKSTMPLLKVTYMSEPIKSPIWNW